MTQFCGLVEQLGLVAGDERRFFGVYRGYPLALMALMAQEQPAGVLLQIRHPLLAAELPAPDAYIWSDEFRALLAAGRASISVEERMAWLELYALEDHLDTDDVIRALDGVLEALAAAGVGSPDDRCHYCRQNAVAEARLIDQRVLWVCDDCLEGLYPGRSTAVPMAMAPFLTTALLAMAGAVCAAMLWTICWAGFDSIVVWLDKHFGVWSLPQLIVFGWVPAAGAIVAAPTYILLRRAKLPTSVIAGLLVAVLTLIGVLAGEVACVTWVIYRDYGILSPVIAFLALPAVWVDSGALVIVLTLGAAIFAMAMAAAPVWPRRRPVSF